MGIQFSSPVVPPDGVLLNTSASGALQLKPGTQGDILYAGAAGVWAKLPVGAASSFLQSQGAGANPVWTANATPWVQVEATTTFAAAASAVSGTLTAYNEYMAVFEITSSAANTGVLLRLNGDSGNNYDTQWIGNVTIANASAFNGIELCDPGGSTYTSKAVALIAGKTTAIASGRAGVAMYASTINGANGLTGIGGSWAGGNAVQITTIGIAAVTAGTITGKMTIFGRNT